jgi:hypothetical protein
VIANAATRANMTLVILIDIQSIAAQNSI